MKKKFLTALVLTVMSFSAMAQSDGFFKSNYEELDKKRFGVDIYYYETSSINNLDYEVIGEEVPLCGSIYILGSMALGYALIRRKENNK